MLYCFNYCKKKYNKLNYKLFVNKHLVQVSVFAFLEFGFRFLLVMCVDSWEFFVEKTRIGHEVSSMESGSKHLRFFLWKCAR